MWLGGVTRDVFGGVLWRGVFGAMGFTHPQRNFADIRIRKSMIPFHAICCLCWHSLFLVFFVDDFLKKLFFAMPGKFF